MSTGTSVVEVPVDAVRTARGPSWASRRIGPAWPLACLLVGFPLWWLLGLASLAFIAFAVPMAVQVARAGRLRAPAGAGAWLLFLAWVGAGAFAVHAHAPGTIDGSGAGPVANFAFRGLWYLAITVALLYPLALPEAAVPGRRVAGWLAWLFVHCVVLGLLGVVLPHLQVTSLVEVLVPQVGSSPYLRTLVHPALTTASEFLGWSQPRPKAPFAYANSWGNNVALLLPFFVWVWGTSERRLQRLAMPVVLVAFLVPVVHSLNRGLWAALALLAVHAAVVLVRRRDWLRLWVLAVAGLLAASAVVLSPLADTLSARLTTPHSNERRGTVAEVVLTTTWQGSPLLGYGTTRKVEGNFESIGGGSTPDCHQCAAPPLGTQGFAWRLVFTTGFVGTALFCAFVAVSFRRHAFRSEPLCVIAGMVLLTGGFLCFVYDSLESPLFVVMLAVGLANRARLDALAGGAA